MMERFVAGFIRASLVWLGIGVLLGLGMTFWPGQMLAFRAAHMHALLLGFVSMMIFGVAYHVIPRFIGQPLHSRRLPLAHLWVANLGLGLQVAGWMAPVLLPLRGIGLLHGGAMLSAVGVGMFIYTLWRTLDAADAPAPVPLAPPLTQIQRPLGRQRVGA